MKTISILFSSILLMACNTQKNKQVIWGDNSRNALDWAGIYAGTIGSDSLQTVIRLQDSSYQLERIEKDGKPTNTKGNLEWNKEGSGITIDGTPYRLGENRLDILDRGGKSSASLTKLDNPIQEKYWKVVELFGQPVVTAEGQREAYIIFKSFDNRFNGNGGCNGFSGGYELQEHGRIKFLPAMSTQMACANGMGTEAKFHEVLGKADTYIVTGDTLVLTKARMAPMARFEAVYLK